MTFIEVVAVLLITLLSIALAGIATIAYEDMRSTHSGTRKIAIKTGASIVIAYIMVVIVCGRALNWW